MLRRRTRLSAAFSLLLLGAGALWLSTGQAQEGRAPGDQKANAVGDAHAGHSAHFTACAKECAVCQLSCSSCANHCARLLEEGKKDHAKTLGTCLDCADLCAAAAHIVSRNGPFADLACKACADACARCHKACLRFADDAHMKACADECRRCELACRTMLEHAMPATE